MLSKRLRSKPNWWLLLIAVASIASSSTRVVVADTSSTAATACGWDASPTGTQFIAGGLETTVHRLPWHVGVYSDLAHPPQLAQICGGSLLTNRLVVTAAHCFWNVLENQFNRPQHYSVATGKTLRGWDAAEAQRGQRLGVLTIHTVPGYMDYTDHFNADIAVLELDQLVEFHSYVLPVCVLLNRQGADRNMLSDRKAMVAGFGLNDNGMPSERLRSLELLTVSSGDCRRQVHANLSRFLTEDKFCAGVADQRQPLCKGNSGSGLVVWEGDATERKTYYLEGVVSTGAYATSCGPETLTFYTSVALHADFIRTVMEDVSKKYA